MGVGEDGGAQRAILNRIQVDETQPPLGLASAAAGCRGASVALSPLLLCV